jgi:hypothetical protein
MKAAATGVVGIVVSLALALGGVATDALNAAAHGITMTRSGSGSTVLTPGTIEGHRFVKSFSLSRGALEVTPFHGATPDVAAAEATTMWATQGIGGTIEGLGYADVTLSRTLTRVLPGPRVSALVNTPALVGLAHQDDVSYSCPVMFAGQGTSVIPVSQGWYAVIFPLNLTKSDVVFSASSNVCGHVTPNTVGAAYETLSVDWHLETHPTTGTVIVASVPRCGSITMSGGGGNEYTHEFEYQVEATVLDRPVGTTCSPATNFDEGPAYASPSTTHGFTGPVLSVSPHAGDVVTSAGPRPQPLT